MIEDVKLDWFEAVAGREHRGPTPDEEHARNLAGADGSVVPVTLDWKIGCCEQCDWRGNPTPKASDAKRHAAEHALTHSEVDG